MSAEDDLRKIAQYFNDKYGSLQKALELFPDHAEFDLASFEVALKRWGIKVDEVADIFDYIDIDWSGRVSVTELFAALQQPMEEIRAQEQLQRQTELAKMYRELAKRLRSKFSSIDSAIEQLLELRGKDKLSLTDFRKLIKKVNLELSSSQLQRIFEDVDENKDGDISVTELKDKTGVYIVQDVQTEMAKALTERCGSVRAAFAALGSAMADGTGDRSTTPTSGAGPDAHMLLEEDAFTRILRSLEVANQVDEATTSDLYQSLAPKTLANFQGVLERMHESQVKRAQQLRTEFKKRVQELQRQEAEEAQHAGPAVVAWMEKAASRRDYVEPGDVTRGWETAARQGHAKTQLSEYITVLTEQLKRMEVDVENVKAEVAQREEIPKARTEASEDPSPVSMSVSPGFMGTLNRMPSNLIGIDIAMPQRPAAERAQRLVQAVAAGKTSEVQHLIGLRTDVNITAWGGVTPMMAAAYHGRVAVMSLLLTRRADLWRTDLRGRTALDHARRQPHAQAWLRSRGALHSKEQIAEVAGLARRMQILQAEQQRLESHKEQLPSAGLAPRFIPAVRRSGVPGFFNDGAGAPSVEACSDRSPCVARSVPPPGPPKLEGLQRPRMGTAGVQPWP